MGDNINFAYDLFVNIETDVWILFMCIIFGYDNTIDIKWSCHLVFNI